ncbi:hypothetical protein HELRODRAFT_172109 [Helobdella robusta]|uniref:Dynein heavy chain linker domain-containing protein n=1 Tax=Helobdella robusta TaxID=6412 RepID=T1F514_HELRO|nr:hypothetical protein HELRODRAFT_172109 [Helobdella robusta]ESO05091.1 hypothetical protein HELRODRAFT_172109 [Helobdella robusta]
MFQKKHNPKLSPITSKRSFTNSDRPQSRIIFNRDLSPDGEPKIRLRGYYSDILGGNTLSKMTFYDGASNYENFMWNAFTEQHMPNGRDFLDSSYEPKVQLPYKVLYKSCPREVEILRRKKQFASLDLETLLRRLNIDTNLLMPKHEELEESGEKPKIILNYDQNDPAPFPAFLNLELFDDTEYDCRNPIEWIALGRFDTEIYKPVPGLALLPVLDEHRDLDPRTPYIEYKWVDVGMLNYDPYTRRYLVQKVDCNGRVLNHEGKPTIMGPDVFTRFKNEPLLISQYWVPRIQLMFRAEDPEIFARRVADACNSRRKTESLLRYELYVDCMPLDRVGEIDPAVVRRIVELTKKGLNVKDRDSMEELLFTLTTELRMEFSRTMNKIAFNRIVYDNPSEFAFVTLPDCIPEKWKVKGCISDIPSYPFEQYFKSFVFHTLLIKPEISQAITKVRTECQRVTSMSLFNSTTLKSAKVEEFEQIQSQATAQVSLFMRDSWIATLRVAIRTSLRDLGKGWFNLYEKNWTVYQISKMKRFMDVIKFYMQDALRYLVQDSLSSFVQMVLDACHSTMHLSEDFRWEGDLLTSPFKPKRNPLINLEIGIENNEVVFSYPINQIPMVFVNLFNKGIQSVQNIPQLEKLVLEDILFPDSTYLEAVGMYEPAIEELRKILTVVVMKSLIPMNSYATQYEQYIPIIQLDANAFLKELENKGTPPLELKNKIEMYEEMQDIIKARLPNSIVIGMFHLSVDNLRQRIVKKACEEYKMISRKLFERPNCIEEVVEKRDWIRTIPMKLEEYMGVASKAMEDYDLIEGFNYNLSNEDFAIKWNTVGWPHKINLQIEYALQSLSDDEEKYKKLQMHVANIPGLVDIGKAHEYANQCRRLYKELKEAQADSAKYNSREKLFNMPITSYEKVNSLIKDFEQYRLLWVTTSDWLRWYDSWMNDPLQSLDPDFIEKNLTDELGFTLNTKSDITFAKCLDMKLQDHVEAIEKVAEIASKEYSIEKILDKMSSDWENVNFEILSYKQTGTFIIKISDDISQMLDDHISTTQSLSFSQFKQTFEERIQKWESRLTTCQEVLDMWLTVQKQWLYLEPIFSSEDIVRQLPVESKRFQTVDRSWRKIIKMAVEDPRVISICGNLSLLMSLTECHHFLEQVEKGLSDYLETKRMVTFGPDKSIMEMISGDGEIVPFRKECFKPEGNVENWMLKLEEAMRKSLKQLLKDALDDYIETPRDEWVLKWPGQLVIAGAQAYWSAQVTEAISSGTLNSYLEKLLAQLDGLRRLVSFGILTKMSREILSALIVIEVHARDVVSNMADQLVKNVNDFEYYWMNDDFFIRAVNAEFPYGFEYLGNSDDDNNDSKYCCDDGVELKEE